MAPSARGADLPATLPLATALLETCEKRLWVGEKVRSAGASGHLSGGHGVPSVRTRGGVSVTRFHADAEGPDPGRTAGSWPEESWREASGRREAPHPPGKTEPPRNGRKEPPATAAPAQQEASRSEEKGGRAPAKQNRPPRSGRKMPRWRAGAAGADLACVSVHGVDWQANCFGSAPAGTSRAGRARASRAPGLPLRTRR